MFKYFLIANIFTSLFWQLNKISQTNALKLKAEVAYQQKDFQTALGAFYKLHHDYKNQEEEVIMNLAHCYYQLGAYEPAKKLYSKLIRSEDKMINSNANLQLGVLAANSGKIKKALSYFKTAIKVNEQNEVARYNYELLKKKTPDDQLAENKVKTKVSNRQDGENEAQKNGKKGDEGNESETNSSENPDKNNPPQPNQHGGLGNQPTKNDLKNGDANQAGMPDNDEEGDMEGNEESTQQNKNATNKQLESAHKKEQLLSQQRALQLLESMRQQEVQYVQQLKRKPQKIRDKSKPDW